MTLSFTIREPGSAITHFIAMIAAYFASTPILLKASANKGRTGVVAIAVFMASMILLYAASTLYHSVNLSGGALKIFKRIDHMMIFVLIAGSYTPVCMLVLEPRSGRLLLMAIWAFAAIGMSVKAFWVTCPKWFSSVIYIAMGWACVSVFPQLLTRLSKPAFSWLLLGGILYTAGGVIYALKLPLFNLRHKNFGSHEIFHLFVMAGSLCHFICMYGYVI